MCSICRPQKHVTQTEIAASVTDQALTKQKEQNLFVFSYLVRSNFPSKVLRVAFHETSLKTMALTFHKEHTFQIEWCI